MTMILKYRYGQLWNMKIAFRQQRPHFPGLESHDQMNVHIVGKQIQGGKVPAFKVMYIARHDQALVLKYCA